MAFDDVAGLDVDGQDHDVIPYRAARLLDFADRPVPVSLARTEREPRSVGAVEEVPLRDPGRDLDLLPSPLTPGLRHTLPLAGLRQAQQALELPPVEAHHHLAVDDGHGRGPIAEPLELLERRRILADVPVREPDALLRKKLFLCLAARSAGLAIKDDLFCHQTLLSPPRFIALGPKLTDRKQLTTSVTTPGRRTSVHLSGGRSVIEP